MPLSTAHEYSVWANALIFLTAGVFIWLSGTRLFVLLGMATSLPELSSITDEVGAEDLPDGHFMPAHADGGNVSLILLNDAVYPRGPVINELGAFEVVSSLLGVTLTGIFLVGLLERRNPVVMRMGYDSLGIILLFSAGIGLLYAVGSG